MQALHIIAEEHQSLAAILHAIRFMLKEVAAGKLQPDLKLFQAMVHYLDAYAEKRHHPKEDLLFQFLTKRTGEGAEALAQLAVQHGAAAQRIAALQQALESYLVSLSDISGFAQAFDAYADFYRNHMMLEESVVLPLIRKYLTTEDWAAVDAEFAAEMTLHSGKDGKNEDFANLFSRLVDAAPAPIGFGSGPFQG